MLGRGIDQILPHPCNPRLHERNVASAEVYLRLAEDADGAIPRPASLAYVWGDALDELERMCPDLRLINLETSITRSETYFPKGINYRVSPENARCLLAAGVDCCALANNHVLDWGRDGLLDTLETLERLSIKSAGAGRSRAEAWTPAVFDIPGKGRVLFYSCASITSGAPRSWAAKPGAAGIALLPSSTERSVALLVDELSRDRRENDVVALSLHWGPNWGYDVSEDDRRFAHRLIDEARISILHCHSSHHPKGIEVYHNRLVLYGCGDFLNDYEGISGYEEFRGDLSLMYFAVVEPTSGDLIALEMTPLQISRFRLTRPSSLDTEWLRRTLDRECRKLGGATIELGASGRLALAWNGEHVRGGAPSTRSATSL
jgi:poly-gamma-glutamate capsule biosynthesis protein CapA/YwtB (metallophosphatase superfamily)